MQILRQFKDSRKGGTVALARIGQKYYVFRHGPDIIESVTSSKKSDWGSAPVMGSITDDVVTCICKGLSKLSASVLYSHEKDLTRKAINILHGIPKGLLLLKGRAVSICKEMGFPYRQAMHDYHMVGSKLYPNISGILVSARTAELVEHIQNAKRGVLSGDPKIQDWLVSHDVISRKQLLSLRASHEEQIAAQCVDKILDS